MCSSLIKMGINIKMNLNVIKPSFMRIQLQCKLGKIAKFYVTIKWLIIVLLTFIYFVIIIFARILGDLYFSFFK